MTATCACSHLSSSGPQQRVGAASTAPLGTAGKQDSEIAPRSDLQDSYRYSLLLMLAGLTLPQVSMCLRAIVAASILTSKPHQYALC